jgi:hypothetical protein
MVLHEPHGPPSEKAAALLGDLRALTDHLRGNAVSIGVLGVRPPDVDEVSLDRPVVQDSLVPIGKTALGHYQGNPRVIDRFFHHRPPPIQRLPFAAGEQVGGKPHSSVANLARPRIIGSSSLRHNRHFSLMHLLDPHCARAAWFVLNEGSLANEIEAAIPRTNRSPRSCEGGAEGLPGGRPQGPVT